MKPNPLPNSDDLIADIFEDALHGMRIADAALARIDENSEFGVTIALNDQWFDINMNDKRDLGEGLLALHPWL